MFNRPRCRDWSPLATQQLRLRNLIQISGHNIIANPKSSVYYTLHFTTMSAPFFTSERLETHTAVIWPEINCPAIVKSTSQFVCIRVWQVLTSPTPAMDHIRGGISKEGDRVNGPVPSERLSLNTTKAESYKKGADGGTVQTPPTEHVTDRVIFLWGVYFSGLVPITKRTDVRLRQNALVFHIHGGFFTSAEYLLPESIQRQVNYFFFDYSMFLNLPQMQQQQMSSTPPQNCDQLGLSSNGKAITIQSDQRRTEFLSPAFQSSMSHKPGQKGMETADVAILSFAIDQNNGRLSPDVSTARSPTPTLVGSDRHCDPNALKIRFLERTFYKQEIRPSYNVDKLLLLQEKQRRFRYKCDVSKEIIDRICMKSAFCLNLQLIANKALLYRTPPRGNPSMGRTLNRLLSPQPEQPKPEVLLRAQDLRRHIEMARFRCRFLTQERDHHKVNLRQLRTRHGQISDENIDNESWLMANFRGLSRDRDLAAEERAEFLRQRQMFDNVSALLICRRRELLYQLKDIYSIECDLDRRFYKINGIYLPNADAYGDFSVQSLTTASNVSVALGYVAHLVMLCSAILNIPLRNKVIYKGSASKMRDDVKVLSEQDREFPLYCRSMPPPDSFLYAVFLLNQNITQLKFMLGLHGQRDDVRATLPNLMTIINASEAPTSTARSSELTKMTTAIANGQQLIASTTGDSQASVSNSSIDLNVPVPLRIPIRGTHSFSDSELNVADIRICRSVGCYPDETSSRRAHGSNGKGMFYSEPILSTGQDRPN